MLGRTKKMKLAVALALFLAGRKLPKSPLELIQQGAGALSKNEQFAELTQQVRGSLLDAGKAAAGRSAERWLAGVSDRLREGLPTQEAGQDEGQDQDQAEDQDQDQPEDRDQDQAEDEDQDQAEDQGEEQTDEQGDESEETDSQDTEQRADSGSPESRDTGKSGAQQAARSSGRSSGSSRPVKKSGSRSRAQKGA